MPRPKRTKIISQPSQLKSLETHKVAVLPDQYSSRSRHGRPTIQAQNDENEAPARRTSKRASTLAKEAAQKEKRTSNSLAKRGSSSAADNANMSGLASPKSSQRPPLQDITSQQRSPLVDRVAGRSPWASSKKAIVPLEDGFEEFLQSSSPQLPPTTISRPPSAMKAQGTPSFLSIANFKRRTRQPSILRMVQQGAGDANDDEGEDLTLGSLGRSSPPKSGVLSPHVASEELVSSGTKRKASALDTAEEQVAIGEEVEEDGDLPENNASFEARASLLDLPQAPATSASAKRFKKTPPPRRRGRRIKQKRSSTVLAPSSSPPNSASSPHSTPPPNFDQPQAKAATEATKKERASKRRKNNHATENPQTGTTASLKEHLPRGRTRAARKWYRESFDNLGSPEDDSQDVREDSLEISDDKQDNSDEDFGRSKSKRSTTGRVEGHKAKATMGKSTKTHGTESRSTKTKTNPPNATYGRVEKASTSDKENDEGESFFNADEDDEDEDEMETTIDADAAAVRDTLKKSKELAEAKKKFQEVDDWELSFESCDVEGGNSSPWR